jgi:flagellar hook-length control protein FliK
MSLQALPIAIDTSSGSVGLPGALKAGSALPKGRFWSLFAQKLDKTADDAGVISRLASLLQSGTPMATITHRIAEKLTDALARAAGEPGDAKARSTLQRALAAALAPPGSGPPIGSTQQQAAALEQRVKDLLTKLTSELNTAGQKSEFSGKILDAKPAKDTPAPQKSTTPPVNTLTDDVAAFVQSLLNDAANGTSAQAAAAQPIVHAAPVTAPRQPGSAAPLPDLLTRMVARAASADVQRNPAQAPAQPASAGAGSQTAAAAVFQRMIAIIAGQSSQQYQQQQQQQQKLPQNQTAAAQPTGAAPQTSAQQSTAGAAPLFATHVLQAPGAASQPQSATALYASVDPNSVVEQILKGIAVRTAGANSEVRLRLHPEQLGDVTLKLTISGNTIAANVVAQNAHVRDMLIANQHQLARSLAESGLSLGNFSVDVSGGNAGFTGQGSQQQRSFGSKAGAFGAMLIGEEENWGESRFGPAVLTGPKPIVLNYLA